MTDPQPSKPPVARTGMLIRKPVVEVFAAFVDPGITTRFWFTKSSGPLEAGKPATWEWEMYGASTHVMPKVIDPDRRIVIEWDGYTGRTTVEWKFLPLGNDTTFVGITSPAGQEPETSWSSTQPTPRRDSPGRWPASRHGSSMAWN